MYNKILLDIIKCKRRTSITYDFCFFHFGKLFFSSFLNCGFFVNPTSTTRPEFALGFAMFSLLNIFVELFFLSDAIPF